MNTVVSSPEGMLQHSHSLLISEALDKIRYESITDPDKIEARLGLCRLKVWILIGTGRRFNLGHQLLAASTMCMEAQPNFKAPGFQTRIGSRKAAGRDWGIGGARCSSSKAA